MMKENIMRFILVIVTAATLSQTYAEAQDRSEFVFTHANVVPMNKETVLSDYSVIVRDGKITEIGPSSSVTIPAGAIEIDATGKFMIPALSDMHVHLEGDAWNIVYPPETKFKEEEINFSDILFLYTAHDMTSIVVMP